MRPRSGNSPAFVTCPTMKNRCVLEYETVTVTFGEVMNLPNDCASSVAKFFGVLLTAERSPSSGTVTSPSVRTRISRLRSGSRQTNTCSTSPGAIRYSSVSALRSYGEGNVGCVMLAPAAAGVAAAGAFVDGALVDGAGVAGACVVDWA